ncbi:MAG: Asp23/Gls24 family envelope stress response protein [Lachnospiraceae bacterium]|nr:Asp23/Gls24 family envelope stress response protein [Lachnospiraceae bacterium]
MDTEIGKVKIATDVIARIAGIAALDVEGVDAAGGNLNREAVSKVSKNTLGKGVKVNITGGKAALDLSLVMGYGYNIPDTCRAVQQKVSQTVTNMTGLLVSDVNVRVAGIKMPEA